MQKHIKIFSLLCFFLFLNIACEKEETCHCNTEESCKTPTENDDVAIYEAGTQEFGWATASKSGYCWKASSYMTYSLENKNRIAIHFETFNSYAERREILSIGSIFTAKPTKYNVNNLEKAQTDTISAYGSLGLFIYDGDALVGGWSSIADDCSFVNITEIDTVANIVKGEFEVFLTPTYVGGIPEQDMHFTNGKFEASLWEE